MSSKDFSELIGVSYEEMNCWDLTRSFYKKVFGLDLKHYYSDTPQDRDETQGLIYTNKGDFVRVESPVFGDIILISVLGLESHIAVYVGDGMLLHTGKRKGSVIDRLSHWDKVVVGYYRATGESVLNDYT